MVNVIFAHDQIPFILGASFLVAGSYFLISNIKGLSLNSSYITFLKVLLSITLVGSSMRLATLGYSFMEML